MGGNNRPSYLLYQYSITSCNVEERNRRGGGESEKKIKEVDSLQRYVLHRELEFGAYIVRDYNGVSSL